MGFKCITALVCFFMINFVTSADTNGSISTCGAELKAHLECTIKARKLNNPPPLVTMSRKELQDGLTNCFTSNACQKPTLEDHGVPQSMAFVPNTNTNSYTECSNSIRNASKSSMETCINVKMPGFAFYNESDSEKPTISDTSASLVASFWIYSTSTQMHNTTVCSNNATVDAVKKCCSDQFAKVFVYRNPFDDLQDSAARYDAFCKASQNCTNQLSPGCVQNFSNSIAVVKECLRKQYETEREKKELTNKFISCMKKSSADNQSSYLTEPKMAEFQAQMCISKWVEALPEHPQTNYSKNSFWDQFNPQPRISSYGAPGPALSVPAHPGPMAGPDKGSASSGAAEVANPFHGTPPQPAVPVTNQTAGVVSHVVSNVTHSPPPPPPSSPPAKEAHPPLPLPVAVAGAPLNVTTAVTGKPPNVTTPHVGTTATATAHSAGRR